MSLTLPISDPTWIFLVVLAIILLAPMLFSKLRIPSIAGLIFAGILIGPFGLHVLDRDSSFELFGQVGIYYIMFLASLEMDMQDVERIKWRAVGFGLLSFALPISIGFIGNYWLLGYGAMAATLMAAMYASHTLVSYPIVLRFGLSSRRSVSMAVGGTIVADTLTLLVLAVVAGTFKEPTGSLYWALLPLKLVVCGFIIIFFFPRWARFFFKRVNDGVVQYIFVMGLVFLGAGLMESVDMEGILGAFLVGIVLNKQIPATSPLMNHIEFIGNALFIPYFLIGVGMLINVRVLADWGTLEVAAVMIVIGLGAKWLAAWIGQKIYRLPECDRGLIFGLTSSRAAATLAIALVGYDLLLPDGSHLLDEEVLNGTMLLILVSCIVSSAQTEWSARKVSTSSHVAHHTPAEIEDRIVLALSNPETADSLVNLGLMMRTPKSTSPLSAIHIVLEGNPERVEEGKKTLAAAARTSAAANVRMQTHSRWSVNVVSGLTHAMKELDASDLIVGLHQKDKLFESFFGSISTALFSAVDRQIFVYRPVLPLSTIRRIQLVVPKRAEFEPAFDGWVNRVALLAQQLSCAIEVYAAPNTIDALSLRLQRKYASVQAIFHEYDSWNEYFSIAQNTKQDHLAVFVVARQGTLSYHNYFPHLPEQIERYFSARNLLIVFPKQYRGTIGQTSVLVAN